MPALSFDCEFVHPSGFHLRARFEMGPGVTALYGASGSGKTTILMLIAGLIRPRRGSIVLNDRVLTDVEKKIHLPPEKRNIGFVFQQHCLFPHMSVRQNLEYGLRRQQRRSDLKHVVEILEIGDLLARAPHTLSGGQRQRVALGRALLRNPELLLLDEPLTALDEPLQERILAYLKRVLHEYNLPTLFVSHDSGHVRALARRVVSLRGGEVVQNSRTTSLFDELAEEEPERKP